MRVASLLVVLLVAVSLSSGPQVAKGLEDNATIPPVLLKSRGKFASPRTSSTWYCRQYQKKFLKEAKEHGLPNTFNVSNCRATAFAAGSFLQLRDKFEKVKGVLEVKIGYTGGFGGRPKSYAEVCRGKTGHSEAVLVVYDSTMVDYQKLLQKFFASHDPTSKVQGKFVGHQYRSAVFLANKAQLDVFAAVKKEHDAHADAMVKNHSDSEKPLYIVTEPVALRAGQFFVEKMEDDALVRIRADIEAKVKSNVEELSKTGGLAEEEKELDRELRRNKMRYDRVKAADEAEAAADRERGAFVAKKTKEALGAMKRAGYKARAPRIQPEHDPVPDEETFKKEQAEAKENENKEKEAEAKKSADQKEDEPKKGDDNAAEKPSVDSPAKDGANTATAAAVDETTKPSKVEEGIQKDPAAPNEEIPQPKKDGEEAAPKGNNGDP